MKIHKDMKFALAPDVVFQEVSGELVILDLKSEGYFGLNDVGATAWALFNEGQTVSTVVDALTTEYEVDSPQAQADIERVLIDMLDAGLIVRDES